MDRERVNINVIAGTALLVMAMFTLQLEQNASIQTLIRCARNNARHRSDEKINPHRRIGQGAGPGLTNGERTCIYSVMALCIFHGNTKVGKLAMH